MTTKECLEDLIQHLEDEGYIVPDKRTELIATLHRAQGDGST